MQVKLGASSGACTSSEPLWDAGAHEDLCPLQMTVFLWLQVFFSHDKNTEKVCAVWLFQIQFVHISVGSWIALTHHAWSDHVNSFFFNTRLPQVVAFVLHNGIIDQPYIRHTCVSHMRLACYTNDLIRVVHTLE